MFFGVDSKKALGCFILYYFVPLNDKKSIINTKAF